MSKKRLLLTEDDESLGATLSDRLKKEGYEIKWVNTGSKLLTAIEDFTPDLFILDVGLPDTDGFKLVGKIQSKKPGIPFIFLTANASAPDRLKGYELGAEEFIPKPFQLKELLLRIKKVLSTHQVKTKELMDIIEFDSYRIDFMKYVILCPSGEQIPLSKRDCSLLQFLIQENSRVVSRDEILDKIWGEESFPTNRTIDNSIVRLRQSLGNNGQKAIQSVRGVGYRWIGDKG